MQTFLLSYAGPLLTMTLAYLPQLLLALITLWAGFKLVRFAVRAVEKMMQLRHVDPTVSIFFQSLVSILLKILILLSVAAMVGIQTTSFIAVIGAATLAVGMSLQGSLSNFAGGIIILFLKPFRVGDEIEGVAKRGVVERIEIFYTILRSPDGDRVIIPNGSLSNGVIVNFTQKKV